MTTAKQTSGWLHRRYRYNSQDARFSPFVEYIYIGVASRRSAGDWADTVLHFTLHRHRHCHHHHHHHRRCHHRRRYHQLHRLGSAPSRESTTTTTSARAWQDGRLITRSLRTRTRTHAPRTGVRVPFSPPTKDHGGALQPGDGNGTVSHDTHTRTGAAVRRRDSRDLEASSNDGATRRSASRRVAKFRDDDAKRRRRLRG